MPRPATGQVIETQTQRGRTFALRFRAYGKRRFVTLGSSEEGWDRARADRELQYVLADVERGVWKEVAAAPRPAEDPTFYEFANQWFHARRDEWDRRTALSYLGHLNTHLLPFFARHRLTEITVAEVDRYRETKVREAGQRQKARAQVQAHNAEHPTDRKPLPRLLSASTINKTLTRLGQVLDVADERDLLPNGNPLRRNPKNRKLKEHKPRPVYLDSADHIAALLAAATDLETNASGGRRTVGRRALVATLVFAGLRAAEAGDLLWRDVDLAAGRISVGRAKTSASYREVDLLPALRDELDAWKATAAATCADDRVFPTARGGRRDKDNIRGRVVAPIARRAGELLDAQTARPLPRGVSPHKLRHTFASVLFALGCDPAYVMGQLGHTDPRFTLRVYTHAMRRGDDEREALRALVEGRDWAAMGSGPSAEDSAPVAADDPRNDEAPAVAGAFEDGSDGTRTRDLRRDRPAQTDPQEPETPENTGD